MGLVEYLFSLAALLGILLLFTIAFRIQQKAGWTNLSIMVIAGIAAYSYTIIGFFGILCGILASAIAGYISRRLKKTEFTLFTLTALIIGARSVSLEGITAFTNGQAGKFVLFGQPIYLAIFFVTLLVIFFYYWINKKIGLLLMAVHSNEIRFKLLGYDSTRYKQITWMLSGIIASVAGILLAIHLSYIGPNTFSWNWTNAILASSIFSNPLFGATVITAIPELARFIDAVGNGAALQQAVIAGTILLLFWRTKYARNKKNKQIV